ncbi:MAG: aldehyde dehydrogenase family protein, partial [Mesorhizobium sp.]
LGGKSPQLVFADADLHRAAAAIAGSVIFNAGQACVAGTRLIVEKSVADRLTAAVVERTKAVRPGSTWNEATQYSPIISERQRARVDGIVRAAVEDGGECLTGGGAMEAPGYFYAPTLITNVDQANPAIVEEIFGPVLTVQTFETEEEALALSSHPTYGLASGLFTTDLSRTIRLARKLEAGTVWINRYSRSRDHILPTGGYKRSGIGKDLGREAYLANRGTKSVLISL